MSAPDLIGFLKSAYPNGSWPRPFHVLEGLQRVAAGETPKDAARAVGTSLHFLEKAQESGRPEFDILGVQPGDLTDNDLKKAGVILGQLLIGRAAEIAFEDIYRQEIGPDVEFKLVDLREGRTDTDYRVLNGRNRPIYRVHIKFLGQRSGAPSRWLAWNPTIASHWQRTRSSELSRSRKENIFHTSLR